jgi:preprotein translocase subunit SecD
MNHFPAWKNTLIFAAILFGALIAVPNIFGDDPALQISRSSGSAMTELEFDQILLALDEQKIGYSRFYEEEGRAVVLFDVVAEQLRASDSLLESLGKSYVVALTLAPRTPDWMRGLGLKPMSLGLDLRGGVHFLFEVDIESAVELRLKQYESDFDKLLRKDRIKRNTRLVGDEVIITLGDANDADRAAEILRDADPDILLNRRTEAGKVIITARMSEEQVRQRRDFAIEQNTVTLRNRVNELGVAEPLVQRQGLDRIVVQLPGVQDPAQAERVLGATATLEFRLVCSGENAMEAKRRGRAPIGCELYADRDGNPVLVKRSIIVSGDQLVDATSGFSQGSSAVFVKLDSKGARDMLDTTKNNLQKPMAVIFIEQKRDLVERDGKMVEVNREEREVINVATIQGVFSSNFQITGVDVVEARDLSLLLRAGALAAPIYKVEGRMIGPSLGQDNIDKGMQAIIIGLVLVAVFMVIYYRSFGLIADLALITNLVLIVALLSMLQASLTLPGIAGIVLTVGMAVDSNVLIFERIREELRNGNSPQASIHAGYQKALSTIADANITTLIAAIVLFVFGTGPIKGFAITLSLGILTSMFTAIIGTRAVVNLAFGRRNLERLSL